jgi:hypothetical protein
MTGLWVLWAALIGLLYGQILAFVYAVLEDSIPGLRFSKGMMFGVIVWLIAVLPAGLNMLLTMNIAGFAVLYNILQGLVASVLAGIVIAETITSKKSG